MLTSSQVLTLSLPVVAVSILSTVFTLTCFWFRESIGRLNRSAKHLWNEMRGSFPTWLLVLSRTAIGVTGIGIVVTGIVLMPLPGPGALIVLAGAGLLDVEFDWMVPFLSTVLEQIPENWRPDSLKKGLVRLRKGTNPSSRSEKY